MQFFAHMVGKKLQFSFSCPFEGVGRGGGVTPFYGVTPPNPGVYHGDSQRAIKVDDVIFLK